MSPSEALLVLAKMLAFFNATEALFEHDEQFGILKRNSEQYAKYAQK